MARPPNADPQATRRRVLDTARALFSERGAGSTSIRDIARGAGVSLATVHHHFGSKDGLYESCIDAMYDEIVPLRTEIEAQLAAGGSAEEILDRGMRTCYRFARAHRAAIRLLLRTVIDTGELDTRRRERNHLPFLREGAEMLALLLPGSSVERRLMLQSVMHLVVRYAVTQEHELAMIVGNDPVTGTKATQRAVEDHLVVVTRHILGLPPISSPPPPSRPRRTRPAKPPTGARR